MEYVTLDKKLEKVDLYDVVVCGAGPSGVCAAITAARNGKNTLLLDNTGCLGGYWTSGLMCITLDVNGKGGLVKEIYQKLDDMKGIEPVDGKSYIYDPEMMKVLLEELCSEAGVQILYQTRVIDTVCESGRISAIITANQSGCKAYSANIFLDCTGNGELAAYAGCSYETGHPKTGLLQPASLHAMVTGVPDDFKFEIFSSKSKQRFRELMRSVGIESTYQSPLLFKVGSEDLWCMAITHQYGVGFDSSKDFSRATLNARSEIHHAVNALKTIPGWQNLRVVTTSEQLGLREGRRIKGLYKITADDLIDGKRHQDAICLVNFEVDIHALDSSHERAANNGNIKVKPYNIPFRSLVSSEISNLGMAGRCICGDFYAHASYRVIGNAAATGEAIGYAAALALSKNKRLAELDGKKISSYMQDQNYEL